MDDHEKYPSRFPVGFSSACLTEALFRVVVDRFAWFFNISADIWGTTLNIPFLALLFSCNTLIANQRCYLWTMNAEDNTHYHIRFTICFPNLHDLDVFLWIINHNFLLSQIPFYYLTPLFWGNPHGQFPINSNFWHLVGQELSSNHGQK